MNIIQILLHADALVATGKDIQSIVSEIVQHKEKFPSVAEFQKLIDDAIGLLGAGIISLPAADSDVVKAALMAVKDALGKMGA